MGVDGSTATSWMSNTTSSAQWVQVDLGASQGISNVKIYWPATYFAKAYQIQTSTDGVNWTSRFSATSANGTPTNATFTAVSARYVRVNCTTRNNSAYYGVAELEVYAAVPTNQALNKGALASTTRSSTYVAGKAVDGSTATSWMSSTTSSAQWVRVDLGSSLDISNIKVLWPATYFAKAFRIETSTNDNDWTQQFLTTSGNSTTTSITFATVSARYVRVYCTTHNNSAYYGISELEVYQ